MYKLTKGSSIIRLADNACIPADSANGDYLIYLRWLSDNNTPEPAFTPEELAQQAIDEAARQKDEADVLAARTHAKLVALKNMTPAQVEAWCGANITNLATAKDALTTLAVAVSILARRL